MNTHRGNLVNSSDRELSAAVHKSATRITFVTLCVVLVALSLNSEGRALTALEPKQAAETRENATPQNAPPVAPRSRGTLVIQLGHIDKITSAVFSSDGKRILTGSQDSTAILWDVATSKEVRGFRGHTKSVTSVAFSPDGKRVLTGSMDKSARVWDTATGTGIHIAEGLSVVTSVAFSPDGTQFLTGHSDKIVRLWNTADGKAVSTFEGHTATVKSVAFSPDGKQCLVGCEVGETWVWDIATRKDIHRIRAAGIAAYSPDGKRVLVGGQFWDSATGKETHRLQQQQKDAAKSLSFSPDGKRVLTVDATPRMWNAENGELLQDYAGVIGTVNHVAFSPKGAQFLATIGNSFSVWPDAEPETRVFRGHSGMVTAVAFSADGKQAFTGGYDKIARLWDAATGKEIRVFRGHNQFTGPITSVAVSPNGEHLLTGSEDKSARLWEAATGKTIHVFQNREEMVGSVAFSQDQKHAVTGYRTGGARLWEVASGKEIASFEKHGPALSVAFSPDGKQVLVGSGDKSGRLWDVATGKELQHFKWHRSDINAVSFSSDSKQVLTGSGDMSARLWDVETGKVIRNFTGHNHVVDAAVFSPDDKYVLTGSGDMTARLWDAGTGKEIRQFTGHRSSVSSVCFSRDGKQILTASWDLSVRLWDTATGKSLRVFQERTSECRECALSPDGKLVLGWGGGSAWLWDAATGKLLHQFPLQVEVMKTCVSFSSDGKQILAGCGGHQIQSWDVVTGKLLKDYPASAGKVIAVAFSPDGQHAFTVSGNAARMWHIGTGKEVRSFIGHSGFVNSVAVSSDGKTLLTGGLDATARLWDVATGQELRAFERHSAGVRSVAFSPNGKQVLTGSIDRTAKLWEATTGKEIHTFVGHSAPVHSVAFSADGKQCVIASDTIIRLRNTENKKIVQEVKQPTGRITQVALSQASKQILAGNTSAYAQIWDLSRPNEQGQVFRGPASPLAGVSFSADGKFMLTASRTGPLRLWDGVTGKLIRTLEGEDGTTCSAFSRDGMQIAAGYQDGATRVWDRATGKPIQTCRGHVGDVKGVAFSPDGTQLVTGGEDRSARLWDVSTGKETRAFMGSPFANDGANFLGTIYSVAFSPDGRFVLTGGGFIGIQGNMARLWDTTNGREVRRFPGHGMPVTSVAFSPDGKQILSGSWDMTTRLWDTATARQIHQFQEPLPPSGLRPMVWSVAFSPDGTQVLVGAEGLARLWNAATGKMVHTFRGHTSRVVSVAFCPNSKRVMTASWDGTARMWDTGSGEERCKFIGFQDGTWVVVTTDDYYMGSRGKLDGVAFGVGDRSFPFEQFDLQFNRPDKVLESIGSAPSDMIAVYRLAYQKRIKRMNISEMMLGSEFHVPEITVAAGTSSSTREQVHKIKLRARDTKYLLEQLRIDVNGVPVHGTAGISLRKQATKDLEQEVEIELTPGPNRIDVSVLNEKGAESLKETLTIQCDAVAGKPNLYVVAVGISDYHDARFRLTYADKDARDFAELLTANREHFGEVKVLRILNRDATRENVLKAAEFLKPCRVDDTVALFFAGHGLLDADLNYHFATSDIDFANPAKRGLTYESIEGLLDGLRARRKLLLMDTCHSGELDKETVQLAKGEKVPEGVIKTRTFRSGFTLEVTPKVGLANSYQLLQELFIDLRRGTGAVVIASAGGAEYALESDTWKNGVFTHAMLRGLKGEADRNKDGRVMISELRDFVEQEVSRLTEGRQSPTARNDNLLFDFSLD